MSNIDRFEFSPFQVALSSRGKRSLEVMQERANALRRLADEAPDRRASLLDVAQRLEGLATHAALAAFGRTARLSGTPGTATNTAGTTDRQAATDVTEPGRGLFGGVGRKTGGAGFDV